MRFVSPTGKGVRIDQAGSGLFKSPRTHGEHRGVDFLCTPGQVIVSPIDGKVIRKAFPYAGTKLWGGVVIADGNFSVKMFYLIPYEDIIGRVIMAGDPVGIAQDISKKYKGQGMLPHIHCQLTLRPERSILYNNNLYIDPEVML